MARPGTSIWRASSPAKSSRRRKKIQPDLPAHCWSGKLWTGEKCWNCWGSHQEKSPPDTDTRAFNPLWDSSGKILQTGGIGLRICTKQRFCYEYLVHSFVQRTSLRDRSEEHTPELQSHSFISYAVF